MIGLALLTHLREVHILHPKTADHKSISDFLCLRVVRYVLGSEFFGDLEIKCRPGVLIPRSVHLSPIISRFFSDLPVRRQGTAASVTRLVNLLSSNAQSLPSALRVLDLCTGTACIPLLFHHEFYSRQSRTKLSPDVYLG